MIHSVKFVWCPQGLFISCMWTQVDKQLQWFTLTFACAVKLGTTKGTFGGNLDFPFVDREISEEFTHADLPHHAIERNVGHF